MTTIVLDRQTADRAKKVRDQAEVRDEEGRLLGTFLPASDPRYDCPFTDEEIQKALDEPGGKPLRQILEELRARA